MDNKTLDCNIYTFVLFLSVISERIFSVSRRYIIYLFLQPPLSSLADIFLYPLKFYFIQVFCYVLFSFKP